jgi:ABC-type uncharacterized transport system fused permease/ATPase subunit
MNKFDRAFWNRLAGFARRAFYRMGVTRKADSPDQRISDDIGALIASTQIFTVVLVFGRLEARVER